MADAYSACILSLAPANGATDIFTISGSASKIVRVTEIAIQGTQTTLGVVSMQMVKRSAPNTAGTLTTPVCVPNDSNSPPATAVVRAYTANPSGLGALLGMVRTFRETILASSSLAVSPRNPFMFGSNPIVLRNANELLALNFNGVTVAGGNFAIWVSWTEEAP